MSWNVVLQLDTAQARFCEEFSIPGLRRPSRILIICDLGLERTAQHAFEEHARDARGKATSSQKCAGPIHPALLERKRSAPASMRSCPSSTKLALPSWRMIAGWMSQPPDRWLVLPALARGRRSRSASGATCSTKMSRLQLVPWGGDVESSRLDRHCNVLSMASARAFSSATGERRARRWPTSSSTR